MIKCGHSVGVYLSRQVQTEMVVVVQSRNVWFLRQTDGRTLFRSLATKLQGQDG